MKGNTKKNQISLPNLPTKSPSFQLINKKPNY